MIQYKPVRSIHIRDPRAVALVNELAEHEHRSAANAAERILIEALGGDKPSPRRRPKPGESPQQQFLDNVVVKDTPLGGVSSSEKQNEEKGSKGV